MASQVPMSSGMDLQRHHSMPSTYSQASCNAGHTELDYSHSLDLSASDTVLDFGACNTILDESPMLGDVCLDHLPETHVPNSPPIGLQLRKSESFLDLINEHLKHANSA